MKVRDVQSECGGLHEYGIEVKPMPGNISPGAFMDGRMINHW